MPTLLDSELNTYEEHKAELVGSSEGKFVLIHAQQILGVFDSKMDAIAQGYKLFGNNPFLVKQILKVEAPQNFISNHLGI
jgi:hypothetical protein